MKKYGAVDLKGLTGATATTRWVGGTAAGPPTTGTFAVGDFVTAQDGVMWACTGAGSPGTWVLSGRVLAGTLANIPAASAANAGMLYLSTDYLGGMLSRSNGTTWVNAAAPVNSIGTALVTAKGDLISASANGTPARLAVGASSRLLMPDSSTATGLAWVPNPYVGSVMPTGAIAETFPRYAANLATTAMTSGTMRVVSIWLPAQVVVTSISWFTGSTALATGTHGWSALYSLAGALLRQSNDDTTPTAAAQSVVTFTLSSTFTTTYAGQHILGVMWTATTMPTLTTVTARAQLNTVGPNLGGTSTTGLTTTAPANLPGTSVLGDIPYAFVS